MCETGWCACLWNVKSPWKQGNDIDGSWRLGGEEACVVPSKFSEVSVLSVLCCSSCFVVICFCLVFLALCLPTLRRGSSWEPGEGLPPIHGFRWHRVRQVDVSCSPDFLMVPQLMSQPADVRSSERKPGVLIKTWFWGGGGRRQASSAESTVL